MIYLTYYRYVHRPGELLKLLFHKLEEEMQRETENQCKIKNYREKKNLDLVNSEKSIWVNKF